MKYLLLTLIILILSAPGWACGTFGNIYGIAAKPVGTGYEGIYQARVTLQNDGAILGGTLTSAFGFYSFWNVPACGNSYAVSIEKKAVTFIAPVQFVYLPIADSDNNIEVDFISN